MTRYRVMVTRVAIYTVDADDDHDAWEKAQAIEEQLTNEEYVDRYDLLDYSVEDGEE